MVLRECHPFLWYLLLTTPRCLPLSSLPYLEADGGAAPKWVGGKHIVQETQGRPVACPTLRRPLSRQALGLQVHLFALGIHELVNGYS